MSKMKELSEAEARHMKDVVIELKIDGTRITYKNGILKSDREINRNDRFGHVLEELKVLNWHVRGEMAIPGGNVLQVNAREGWPKAKFFIFDLLEFSGSYQYTRPLQERREKTLSLIKALEFEHILIPQAFKTFDEGWDYVKQTGSEGLVLSDKHGIKYKVKHLKEEKLLITGHEAGKSKGAFKILRNGVYGSVSGTSEAFVKQYFEMRNRGIEVYAEIEYAFITADGIPFQPRLRRIGTLEDLSTT